MSGAVISFPLKKGKAMGIAQHNDSFMLSPLLGKLFCGVRQAMVNSDSQVVNQ